MEATSEPASRYGATSPDLEVLFDDRASPVPVPQRPSVNIRLLLAPFSRAGHPVPIESNGEYRQLGKKKVTVQVIRKGQKPEGGTGSAMAVAPVSFPDCQLPDPLMTPILDIQGLCLQQSLRSLPEAGKTQIMYPEHFKQYLMKQVQTQGNYRPAVSQNQGQDFNLEPSQGSSGQIQNQPMTFYKSLQEGSRSSQGPAPTYNFVGTVRTPEVMPAAGYAASLTQPDVATPDHVYMSELLVESVSGDVPEIFLNQFDLSYLADPPTADTGSNLSGTPSEPDTHDLGLVAPSDIQGHDTNVNEEVAAEPKLPLESAGVEETAGKEYHECIAVTKPIRRRVRPAKYNDYDTITLTPPPRPRAVSQSGPGRMSASQPQRPKGAFTNRGFKWVYTPAEREYLYQSGRYVILRDDFLKNKEADKTSLWRIKVGKRGSLLLQEYVPFHRPDTGELFHVSNWTDPTGKGREVSLGSGTQFIEDFRSLVDQYIPVYIIKCIDQPEISVVKYFNEKRAVQFLMEIYESVPSLHSLFRDTLRVLIHQVTDHDFLPTLLSSGFGDTSTCLSLAKEGLTPIRNQNEAGELTTGYIMKLAQSWAEWNNIVKEACRAILTAPKFKIHHFWMLFMKYPKVPYSGTNVDRGRSCWICPMNLAQNVAQFDGPLYDMATLVQSAPDTWDLSDRPVEPLQFCKSCSRIIRSFHTLWHYNFFMLTTIQERVAKLLIGFKPEGRLDSISMVDLILSDTSWVAKMQLDFQVVLARAKKDATRTVVETRGAGLFGSQSRPLT